MADEVPTAAQNEAAPAAEQNEAAPPQGLEKFWDADAKAIKTEDLGKAYIALQSKLGLPPEKRTEAVASLEIARPQPVASSDEPGFSGVLRRAGLDPVEVGRRFAEKGRLTELQYEALKKNGYTPDAIDDVLGMATRVQVMEMQAARDKAAALAGGPEKLGELFKWAEENIPAADLERYNALARNPATADFAVAWLQNRRGTPQAATEQRPIEAKGGAQAEPPGGAFKTFAEYGAARRDPRFGKDPAYTESVNKRLRATPDHVVMAGGRLV